MPQVVNAVLSRHNFILLGLRGQAKTRILRALTLAARRVRCRSCRAARSTTIRWRRSARPAARACARRATTCRSRGSRREQRYVEKLATPDVTIADMIGDLDPIKAARASLQLSDELTMHYGLVPRANRGIFAINELPDLAGKIQVGLFNILQEGDVQIKGYPVRLPLDLLMVFSANPEDYTARGKIITPLKDRIGSEIRTHYPATPPAGDADHARRRRGPSATAQRRCAAARSPTSSARWSRRSRSRRGRIRRSTSDRASASGCRSRCSRTSSRTPSGARWRPASRRSCRAITDVYAAIPAITGKFELEYEGELKGADNVARELIRSAVGNVFDGWFPNADLRQVTEWFDLGGNLQVDDTLSAAELARRAPRRCRGCTKRRAPAGLGKRPAEAAARRRRSTSCSKGCTRSARSAAPRKDSSRPPSRPSARRAWPIDPLTERDIPLTGSKKKYYN